MRRGGARREHPDEEGYTDEEGARSFPRDPIRRYSPRRRAVPDKHRPDDYLHNITGN